MVLYPTPVWLEEYAKRLNESKDLAESGKGWGVDFNGDFIFVIQNIPVEKVDVEKLPEDLKALVRDYVKGGTAYAYIGLKDGKCTGTKILKDPNEVAAGFKLSGTYENWKATTKGQLDVTRGVMTGKFKLEGDMSKVLRYMKATQVMTKIASSIETEYLDEIFGL